MSNKENADYLMQRAMDAGITDTKELSNFMGQMQVESNRFNSMEENLHYSAERLLAKFPGRGGIDDIASAKRIAAGGPEAVGDAIYAGKNGNTEPGDGYNYRGRGYVQLTGRGLYEEYAQYTGLDLVNHPELASDKENAATIALAYWDHKVVAHHAEQNVDRASRLINGGDNGLEERRAASAAWGRKLDQGYVPGAPEPAASHESAVSHTLKEGMHNDAVKHAQQELHDLGYLQADPNGRFGPQTKTATEDFQRAQGIDPDGKIGPATQGKLESAVQDHRAAARGQQISDFNAGVPTLRDFSDPSHPQNALYSTIKDGFPPGTSPELLNQATAACYMAGIRQPDDLGNVYGNGSQLVLATKSIFADNAKVDLTQPTPSVQQTMQQVQQFDQQQALHSAQFQTQQAQINAR